MIGIAVALGIALLPFGIGGIGLAIGSSYLANYHWYAYFSIPTGVVILLATLLAALILPVIRRKTDG